MTFFHARIDPIENNTTLKNPDAASIGPNAIAALESARPPGAPSRAACFFACESPENAINYLQAEQRRGTIQGGDALLYTVEFPAGHWKGPMALIAIIEERLAANTPADSAIAEYWTPTLPWGLLRFSDPR